MGTTNMESEAQKDVERSAVKVLDVSDEFIPRDFVIRVFNLRNFGIPQIPCISQQNHRQKNNPSMWHAHKDCIEFIYCANGECEYESEGRMFHLMPGKMFVSRPHEAHRQIERPKGHAIVSMMFQPSGNATVRWFADKFERLPRLFSCNQSIANRFGRIFALAERGDRSMGARIRMQTLVQTLLLEILDSAALSITRKIPDVFGAIAERMQRHPERDYPLDALVAETDVSKASFISMFKMANGHTPHSYLLHCRIEESKELLRKGLSVKAVADRFGFPSAQHFSRTFRNFTGVTPKKWLAAKGA